jgi:putative hydrolase of the HAD superfamily
MNAPQAVLFDLYDTLARIEGDGIAAGRRRGAERAGVDPECLVRAWADTVDARSRGALGPPREELRRLLAACGGEVEGAALDDLVAGEAENWCRGVRLYGDTLDGLRALRERGCRLAIVSNCSWQTRAVVEASGLAACVDAAILSFEARAMKPEPAMLRLAPAALGVAPEGCVLVDDLAENLDAARALGMVTVLMDRRGGGVPSHHPAAGSLAEVAALLPA